MEFIYKKGIWTLTPGCKIRSSSSYVAPFLNSKRESELRRNNVIKYHIENVVCREYYKWYLIT